MSYQIDLASVAAPQADFDVFPFMNRLKQEAAGLPPSPLLQRFHDALSSRFPDSPWMKEYAGDHGRLTLMQRAHDIVPHVLHIAAELGLTVVDKKSAEVHRPPTYQVVLEGTAEGAELQEAAEKLAGLMKQPVERIHAILAGGHKPVVKKGVSRTQATLYVDALRKHGACHATISLEPGAVERPEPPTPAPAPSPVRPALQLTEAAAQAPAPAPAAQRASEPVIVEVIADASDANLFEIAEGVRLMCISIGLNILFRKPLDQIPPMLALLCSILLLGVSAYGCFRVAKALDKSALIRLASFVLPAATIPVAFAAGLGGSNWVGLLLGLVVVNLLLMLYLAWLGTRRLKRAGLKLGLFGAAKADVRALAGMRDDEKLGSTLLAWGVFGIMAMIYLASPKDMGAPRSALLMSSADRPCRFVGQWEHSIDGQRIFLTTMNDEGRFEGVLQTDQARSFGGEWYFSGDKLYWKHMSGPQKGLEVNQVRMDAGQKSFTITAANGNEVRLDLVSRGSSQRCKY
jgi:hypothetical protein